MLNRRLGSFTSIAPCLLVAFFVIKAVITGTAIVRPWDVPDEVGHFSYISDLATGKGLPVLHETYINEEIWAHFTRHAEAPVGSNWIAQHPPLYHVVMVPAYWIGSLFGDSFWGSFYLIRAITALFFGLGIFVLVRAFQEVDLSPTTSLGLGLMLACVPAHTYLAAAVNHDALIFLFGSLVLLYWVRFIKEKSESCLVKLGLILGLGALIKYTVLALFPVLLVMVGVILWRERTISLRSALSFIALVFIPILLWMTRNLILLGEPLPVDTTGFHSDHPLEMGILEFGQSYPLLSILVRSYWGLLGWMGDGTLEVRWFQIYSIYQQAYTWPLIILVGLSLFFLGKETVKEKKRLVCSIAGLLIAVVSFVLSGWWRLEQAHYLPLFFVLVALSGWRIAETCVFLGAREVTPIRVMELSSLFVFLAFLFIHLYKVFNYSISSGVLQGTFGRYYLLVVGFFIIGCLVKGIRSFPLGAQLVMIFAMIYSSVELYVWLHEAVPYFYIHD